MDALLPPRVALLVLIGGAAACTALLPPEDEVGIAGGMAIPKGDIGGDGVNGKRALLRLDPENPTLLLNTACAGETARQAFRVLRSTDGVTDEDVTSEATFSLEGTWGSFSGNTFESPATMPDATRGVATKVSVKVGAAILSSRFTVVALRTGKPCRDGSMPSSTARDFQFTVPFEQAPDPAKDVLQFATKIKIADVTFLMDTTGSMGGAINNLKASLSTTIIPALRAAVPSSQIAIAGHRDLGDSYLVKVFQTSTADGVLLTAGVNQLGAGGGGDAPEGQIPAMWHILTGGAVSTAPAVLSAPGTFGAAGMRATSLPIVVLISDAPWHTPRDGRSYADARDAFKARNAKFIGLSSSGKNVASIAQEENVLSDDTATSVPPAVFKGACGVGMCCTGIGGTAVSPSGPGGTCRLNFTWNASNGSGVTEGVVAGIEAIATGATFDVYPSLADDPSDAVDARQFVGSLEALNGDPANGCPAPSAPPIDTNGDGVAETFPSVQSDKPVCFNVVPTMNKTVAATEAPQFYKALIHLKSKALNDQVLDTREVIFYVPPAKLNEVR